MSSDWVPVATFAIGATLPLGVEWIRDRGRRAEAKEQRAEALLREQADRAAAVATYRHGLILDVLDAAAARIDAPLHIVDYETPIRLRTAMLRLALEGDEVVATHAKKWLAAPGQLTKWTDDLVEIVAQSR